MSPILFLTGYCFVILIASMVGGWVPLLIRLTHRRVQLAISLVAGFMLGVGVLHLLPHAAMQLGSIEHAGVWMVIGFLFMFYLERFCCFHHHDAPDDESGGEAGTHGHGANGEHRLTWSGAAVGLTLHSLVAGVGLAASIEAEAGGQGHGAWPGLVFFLVIFLHKPFDSMTLGALLAIGGWPTSLRHLVNGLFALMIPAGAVLFYLGVGVGLLSDGAIAGCALAFSAGMFLCISMSDLLPELQFHRHDRVKLSFALLLGIALAWTTSHFESKHHENGMERIFPHLEDQLYDMH